MVYEGERRVRPSIWHSDYYMLKSLKSKITESLNYLPNNSFIFDYGCGYRPYEELIKNGGHRYLGGDIDGSNFSDIVVDKYGSVPVEDNVYDAVLSVQVLEHVEDPMSYLVESYRVVKKGGYLILSTHGAWTYHPYPTDYWRWTRSGLEKIVTDAGFRCIKSDWIMGMLAYSTMLKLQCMKGLCEKVDYIEKYLFPVFSVPSQLLMMAEDLLLPNSIAKDNAALYVILAKKE